MCHLLCLCIFHLWIIFGKCTFQSCICLFHIIIYVHVCVHSNQSLFRWFLVHFVRTEIMRLLLQQWQPLKERIGISSFSVHPCIWRHHSPVHNRTFLNIRQYSRLIERRCIRSCNGKCSRNNRKETIPNREKVNCLSATTETDKVIETQTLPHPDFHSHQTILLMICFSLVLFDFIWNERARAQIFPRRVYIFDKFRKMYVDKYASHTERKRKRNKNKQNHSTKSRKTDIYAHRTPTFTRLWFIYTGLLYFLLFGLCSVCRKRKKYIFFAVVVYVLNVFSARDTIPKNGERPTEYASRRQQPRLDSTPHSTHQKLKSRKISMR